MNMQQWFEFIKKCEIKGGGTIYLHSIEAKKENVLDGIDKDGNKINPREVITYWVNVDYKEKKSLPHYDRPEYSLSMESAKTDYPYLWSELSIVLPGITDESRRRAIEVFVNTCSSCKDAPSGCCCWNDE